MNKKIGLLWIIVLFLAVIPLVSAQSNLNCTIFPRASVPGDFVPLFNMFQENDTHVEMPDQSNYDYTLACKSNITTLNNTCTDEYVNITSLYQTTDSHVSIDDYYYNLGNNICLSTEEANIDIIKDIGSTTPSDYECLFGVPKMNDSHVFQCEGSNLKVNVRINKTTTCVDNDGDGFGQPGDISECTYTTYADCDDTNASVLPPYDDMPLTSNVTLCSGTFYVNDSGSTGVLSMSSPDVWVTGDDTTIIGDSTGSGVYMNSAEGSKVRNITLINYSNGVYVQSNSHNATMEEVKVSYSDYGVYLPSSSNSQNITVKGLLVEKSQRGIWTFASNLIVKDTLIHNCSQQCVLVGTVSSDLSSDVIFDNITCANNSGFNLQNARDYEISYSTFYQDSLSLYNANESLIKNTTFEKSPTCLSMSGGSTDNLVYHNDFKECSIYNADVDDEGNHFNTTLGGVAQGNYWDDASSLAIQDLNADGFGDAGTDYPYNSTNGGKVNGYVNDWGPIISATPITSDNYTLSDRDWNMDGADILLSVIDSDFDYTEYCYFSIYGSVCVPATKSYAEPTTVSLGCPYNDVCQLILTYHSVDQAGNNETYHNTSQINIVNNSEIYNTSVWNSSIAENSYIEDSEINDSYISDCYIVNSTIINSTVINKSGYRYPCHIENSTIIDSNLTSVKAIQSYIDPSTVIDSLIIISSINDSNVSYSIIGNTTFCAAMEVMFGTLVDNVFTAGKIRHNGTTYYPTLPLESICSGIPVVMITYPPEGSVVNGTFNIEFMSTMNNSPEISIDGGSWTSTTSWNYSTWDTTTKEDGAHTIQIRDQDEVGQYTESNLFTYTVQNEVPGITILRPKHGEMMSGNYTVEALAADYIRKVEFFVQNETGKYGLEGGTATTNDTESTDGWTAEWETENFGEGYYNLTARAYERTFFGTYTLVVDTTKTGLYIDRTSPNISMEIVGSNGTTLTNVRNVVLNMTYEDAGEVDKCRFANDAESGLASQPWEGCTTAKAWILSQGQGQKWVYTEIRDKAGNTKIVNDSIEYREGMDQTPPTQPMVYDGLSGIDIDWWNNNETLGAYWFNATEDVSTIYYWYRILENGSCYDGDCSYTDAGTDVDVNVTGLGLKECYNYSFEVKAYNYIGLNSSSYVSDGVTIDMTAPEEPTINSTTHPNEEEIYGSGDVELNWTSKDKDPCGKASGIEGYSFKLDRYPGTAPDDSIDKRPYIEYAELIVGNEQQELKEEDTGNAYHVMTEVEGNLSINDTVKVRVALAENKEDTRDQMGLNISVMDELCTGYDNCGSIISTKEVTRDIRYSEKMSEAMIYEFYLTVDSAVTDDNFFIGIAGLENDDDNENNLTIAYTKDPRYVDNTTTTRLCEEGGGCIDNESREYAIGVEVRGEKENRVRYEGLPDGTYYFHAKAVDTAGNWGETAHYQVIVDTAGVGVDIISPFNSQVIADDHVDVIVEVNEQANVTVVVKHPDESNDTSTTVLVNDSYTFNMTLEEGMNEIYAEAVNPANGVKTRSQTVYVRRGSYEEKKNKTIRIRYSGATESEAHMRYTVAGDHAAGVATENDAAAFGSDSIEQDTIRYTTKIFATDPGISAEDVEAELDEDEFLDQVNPLFGFERKDSKRYVISTALMHPLAYFEGEQKVGEGNYRLVFKNMGYTPDGKANITVEIT